MTPQRRILVVDDSPTVLAMIEDLLIAQGYQVQEASYGSQLGEHTDDGDWLPKFRDQMDASVTNLRRRGPA